MKVECPNTLPQIDWTKKAGAICKLIEKGGWTQFTTLPESNIELFIPERRKDNGLAPGEVVIDEDLMSVGTGKGLVEIRLMQETVINSSGPSKPRMNPFGFSYMHHGIDLTQFVVNKSQKT